MSGRPWRDDELKRLAWDWGTCDVASIAKRLSRTPAAVREKARVMGLGAVNRGTYSLLEVARITGYDRGRIMTAARRARVPLMRGARSLRSGRTPKGRHYAITHEAFDRIVAELASHPDGRRLERYHRWEWGGRFRGGAPKPEACVDCGRSDVPHHTRGRCCACQMRHSGHVRPDAPRKISKLRWEDRNPPHCRTCERTDRPHAARGDCRTCYARKWASGRRQGRPAIAEGQPQDLAPSAPTGRVQGLQRPSHLGEQHAPAHAEPEPAQEHVVGPEAG